MSESRSIPVSQVENIRCVAYYDQANRPMYYITNRAILYAPDVRPSDARYKTAIIDWFLEESRPIVMTPADPTLDLHYTDFNVFCETYVQSWVDREEYDFLGFVVNNESDFEGLQLKLVLWNTHVDEPYVVPEPWNIYS